MISPLQSLVTSLNILRQTYAATVCIHIAVELHGQIWYASMAAIVTLEMEKI